MKAPSFQWYPKDCDTDENVRAMDDREFGFYVRCLNHSWLNDGIPEDIREVARVIGRPERYVKQVWSRVGRCFQSDGNGRLRNPKQEELRKKAKEFEESRRNAAAMRWQSKSNARALQEQSFPFPIAYASPPAPPPPDPVDPKPKPPVSPLTVSGVCDGSDPLAWFEQVFVGEWIASTWEHFPRYVNSPDLLQKFSKNTPLWMKTRKFREGFGKDSISFLRSGIWQKPPSKELLGEVAKVSRPEAEVPMFKADWRTAGNA